jgi:hypothetical protein
VARVKGAERIILDDKVALRKLAVEASVAFSAFVKRRMASLIVR